MPASHWTNAYPPRRQSWNSRGNGLAAIALLATALLATALLATAAAGQAAGTPQVDPHANDRLLVCNRADASVSIFAVAQRREIARVPTGPGPQECAVSPDGRLALVANRGPTKTCYTLTVIDIVAAKVTHTIELRKAVDATQPPPRPDHVAFCGHRTALVTCSSSSLVVEIDVAGGLIVNAQPTGTATPTRLMRRLLQPPAAPRLGPRSWRPQANRATPTELWICDPSKPRVSIRGSNGKHIDIVETSAQPNRVTFSRDGALALVVCSDSGELLVIDAEPRTLRSIITLHGDRSEQGYRPLDLACDPEAAFAYVSCSVGEMVLVVDLATNAVVDRFDTGRSPYGVRYARPRLR